MFVNVVLKMNFKKQLNKNGMMTLNWRELTNQVHSSHKTNKTNKLQMFIAAGGGGGVELNKLIN